MSELRRRLMMQQVGGGGGYCTFLSNELTPRIPIVFKKNVLKITDVDTGRILLEKDPPTTSEIDSVFYYTVDTPGEHHLKIEIWPEATSLVQLFYGCYIAIVDEELLYNCPLLTSVSEMFRNSFLKEIPPKFFEKNPLIKDFTETFRQCYSLTGETPTDKYGKLWERAGQPGLPEYIRSSDCFSACQSLSDYNTIPSNWR